jgi:hypothetical protein
MHRPESSDDRAARVWQLGRWRFSRLREAAPDRSDAAAPAETGIVLRGGAWVACEPGVPETRAAAGG